MKRPKFKIIICCHKPCNLPSNDFFVPIHGGRAYWDEKDDSWEKSWLINNTIGDNTGDNISLKNNRYNEMTSIYWAWKNYAALGDPEYIGLNHYSRYFFYDKWMQPDTGKWTYPIQIEYGLLPLDTNTNPHAIESLLENSPILYNRYDHICSVYDQYINATKELCHIKSDIDLIIRIIDKKYPEYKNVMRQYLYGMSQYTCNMFIMRKDIFFEYCEWMFPILDEFDNARNYNNLSAEEARFFVSERLTGIFIQKKINEGVCAMPLAIGEIEDTSYFTPPIPMNDAVSLVFGIDNTYFSIFMVALTSILRSSSKERKYEVFVLHSCLNINSQFQAQELVQFYENFKIMFIDVNKCGDCKERDGWSMNEALSHISEATYYRFYLPGIFPNHKKILWLDCDIVVLKDIAMLFDTELGDKWLGAALDLREGIAIRTNMEVLGRKFGDYVECELGMKHPDQYFQAGVLLYNLAEWLKNDVEGKLFEKYNKLRRPIYLNDQDVLNSVCQGHVKFFPNEWNFQWQIAFEFDVKKALTLANYERYEHALNNLAIIHYASPAKPWHKPDLPLASYWWNAARSSWVYEKIIADYVIHIVDAGDGKSRLNGSYITFSKDSFIFKGLKYLLPQAVKRAIKKAFGIK